MHIKIVFERITKQNVLWNFNNRTTMVFMYTRATDHINIYSDIEIYYLEVLLFIWEKTDY